MGRKFGIARDLKDGVLLCAVFPTQNFPAGFRLDRPERISSSLDDTDDSTRKTVQAMCRHIANAQSDPWFLGIAHNLTSSPDIADKISAVFLFCKAAIRFQRDEQSVWNLYKEINQIDFLIEPRAMARMMPKAYGDCDEFTMFSLACLVALGVPCEIVTVACDRDRPGFWSHVYGQVILNDGRRMALDCSPAGKYPGWEVPDRDVQRKQAWSLDGNESEAVATKSLGLHAYIPRPRARRGRRGMGDDGGGTVFVGDTPLGPDQVTITSTPVDFGSPSDINLSSGLPNVQNAPGPVFPSISAGAAPSGGYGGFNINSFLSSLLGAGAQIGKAATLPPGYSLTASGAVVPTSLLGGLNAGNLLLYGGALVVLVLLLGAAKR